MEAKCEGKIQKYSCKAYNAKSITWAKKGNPFPTCSAGYPMLCTFSITKKQNFIKILGIDANF